MFEDGTASLVKDAFQQITVAVSVHFCLPFWIATFARKLAN